MTGYEAFIVDGTICSNGGSGPDTGSSEMLIYQKLTIEIPNYQQHRKDLLMK